MIFQQGADLFASASLSAYLERTGEDHLSEIACACREAMDDRHCKRVDIARLRDAEAMTIFAYLIEPPFNYRHESGTVTGCDVELARIVLSMAGYDSIDLVESEFAQLLPGLNEGRWHMTTGLFATEERRRMANFSRAIWALPDGLLVGKGNPFGLTGCKSIAGERACTLAVIRDQIQHHTASTFGVSVEQLLICENYREAANAVLTGQAAAYASVTRAHSGFIEQNSGVPLEVVTIGVDEKAPAYGCFGFRMSDETSLYIINDVLTNDLGTPQHRAMMYSFGFTDAEIDLVVPEER